MAFQGSCGCPINPMFMRTIRQRACTGFAPVSDTAKGYYNMYKKICQEQDR